MRRSAPCTISCCPPLRAPSPCSSTHPSTPARTLRVSGGTLTESAAKISNYRLCFACRWDLRRQIPSIWRTTPSPCSRYVAALLVSRRQWSCRFAAVEQHELMGLAAGASRALLALTTADPCSPMPYTERVHADRASAYVFRARARVLRANVGPIVGVVRDPCATRRKMLAFSFYL